jgi:anti-sigma regulatory factor (Ser/Thr protein kinase)
MEDLSLHILDIAENSIEAKAKKIKIKLVEDSKKDILSLEIADDGKGMDKETLKKALNPFFTTKKTRRFGLGLPLLAEAAKAANGRFSIQSKPGQGTTIKANFQASHIDTKPLGDITQTIITLIMGHPEIDILYIHKMNLTKYCLDTGEIKTQIYGLAINSPEILKLIKKDMKEGLNQIRRKK